MISFNSPSTVPGLLASRALELLAHWVQSPSDFDRHIVRSMDPVWLEKYQPVISKGSSHVMYTRLTPLLPGGQSLTCPGECKQPLRPTERPEGTAVVCQGCGRRCTVPLVDRSTFLGQKQVMKIPYPLTPYVTEWRNPPSTPLVVRTPPLDAPPTSAPALLPPQGPPTTGVRHSRSAGELMTRPLSKVPGTVMPRKRQSINDFLEADKRRRM